ncbi:MAG TPA: amidohydrolase family protein [Candidatus Limnocylindria bacterium]|nr:amidohydrolase family protein [Candidatus Limnocylindria bacterium]
MTTSAPATLLRGSLVVRDADHAPEPAEVLIADGVIREVGPRLGESHRGPVVELDGHALLPGFVNAHFHSHDVLAKGSFEAMPLELWSIIARGIGRARSTEEVRLRTLLAAIECLRNGFTTVQDFVNVTPGDEPMLDAMLDAYASAGIRVVLALSLRDRSELAGIPWGRELIPASLQPLLGGPAAGARAGLAFVEQQLDRGGRRPLVSWALGASAPHRCSPQLLRGIAALADARGLPVYTHLYETQLQRLFARQALTDHGGSALRYLADAGLIGPGVSVAHAIWVDADELALLASSRTGVILNPLSNLRLGSGIPPVAAYRRAGARLALGSDNASCSDLPSPFQAMKLLCLLGAADPVGGAPAATDALRAATVGGAETAGLATTIGRIEPGMAADLVAVDLRDPAYRPLNDLRHQLVYAETGRGVRHVWVAGRQVVADGRSTLVDEGRLAAEVARLMPAVRDEVERLRTEAERVRPALDRIRARARELDGDPDRYPPA